MLLTRCDEEGVPCLVQAIWYRFSDMKFEVLFFNGQTRFFNAEAVLPSPSIPPVPTMELTDAEPTEEQWARAVKNVTEGVNNYYAAVFRTSLRRAAPLMRRVG